LTVKLTFTQGILNNLLAFGFTESLFPFVFFGKFWNNQNIWHRSFPAVPTGYHKLFN